MDLTLAPTFAGAAVAAAAVAGGAPLFGDGLRTLRLGRSLARVGDSPLSGRPQGFVRVRGRVTLDSPLFGPLSSQACAGYRLVVSAEGHGVVGTIEDLRAFRLSDGEVSARVEASHARWQLAPGTRREVRAGEAISENLSALLARSPEAMWLRRSGVALVLIEHALMAGAECHVVGEASLSRPIELAIASELGRTGTDDASVMSIVANDGADSKPSSSGYPQWALNAYPEQALSADTGQSPPPRSGEPDLWIDGGTYVEYLVVSDRPISDLRVPYARWRSFGIVLGPAMSLAGLFHLASLAERLVSFGR